MNRYDTPLEDAVRVCTAELRATIHELREDLADARSEIEALEELREKAVKVIESVMRECEPGFCDCSLITKVGLATIKEK